MPLHRRLPKRGFTNIFRKEFAIVNLGDLNLLAGDTFDPGKLLELKLIRKLKDGLKDLGSGELKRAIHVKAHLFSESALEKIKAAGGTAEVIGGIKAPSRAVRRQGRCAIRLRNRDPPRTLQGPRRALRKAGGTESKAELTRKETKKGAAEKGTEKPVSPNRLNRVIKKRSSHEIPRSPSERLSDPGSSEACLVHPGDAGGVPPRRSFAHTRCGRPALPGFHPGEPGHRIRLLRSVQRRNFPPPHDFCVGHHALHHLVHHFAVVDRRGPHARKAAEGRRTRPPQDHPVDPLSHRDPGPDSVLRYRQRCKARSRVSSPLLESASS